jgi:hypothetical protein
MGAYGGGGVGYWVGIEGEDEPPAPQPEIFLQAYPNPFRGSATLLFELAEPARVELRVYDLSGRLVEEVFGGDVTTEPMSCYLDGRGLPAGVYTAVLSSSGRTATRRLVLLP